MISQLLEPEIEQEKIRFDESIDVSDECKNLIISLLQINPENRIEWNRYSIPLYEKLCSYQKPLDLSKQNFDYEIPAFNPKENLNHLIGLI